MSDLARFLHPLNPIELFDNCKLSEVSRVNYLSDPASYMHPTILILISSKPSISEVSEVSCISDLGR